MRSYSGKKGDDSSAHPESPHSPLRLHSPLRSDLGDPQETPPYASPAASPENPKINVSTVDKHTQWSPSLSPLPRGWNGSYKGPPTVNRAVRENWMSPYTVKDRPADDHVQEQERRHAAVETGTRSRNIEFVQKAALGFRIIEVILCLISFSIMAADKTKGWSGDSYNRYKEYRYCLAVNVIAFVYATCQTGDLIYRTYTGKHVIIQPIHGIFDFLADQVLAYLLISASSSAASRVDDWQTNWGKDKFTELASASIAMSFLAFMSFAISSLISGFFLFTISDIAA